MSILPNFLKFGKGAQEYAQWSSPDPWRNDDGVFVGLNGQVWIYRKLDLSPVKWEDNEARLGIARQLDNLLTDLGSLSKVPVGNIRALANNREVHIESVTWQEILTSPDDNPPELAEFQSDAYGVTVPKRALFLGVKLVQTIIGKKEGGQKQGLWASMQELARRSMGDDMPKLEPYKDDLQRVKRILDLYEAKLPTKQEFAQLGSWFNQGRGTDVLIEEQIDRIVVADSAPIQMSAARQFEVPTFSSPDDQWLMDALAHPGDAPHMISVRCELEPTKVTRNRARMQQRRIQANIEEEEKSGDIEKVENTESYQLAKDFEDYLSAEKRPTLSNVSILMASEVTEETETYMDFLDNTYGIQMTTLEHRQILALDETLPCSNTRVNPFLQDINVAMLAHAGLQAFSSLGDDRGAFVGFIDPDGAPLFIDPSASSRQNLPPGFGVFGDPGSGKSSPLDTPVFTPEGTATMGDLIPGDRVFGADGRPTTVTSIHPQGKLDTYRVHLADGRYLDTSDQHLWHVLRTDSNEWQNLELGTFMDDLEDEAGEAKWLVPAPRPLEYPNIHLPLDPYKVGQALALGPGGHSSDPGEALSMIAEGGEIPVDFFVASVPQREAVLQGILDARGSVVNSDFIAAIDIPVHVATQLRDLVWSLGGVVQLEESDLDGHVTVVLELPGTVTPFRNNPAAASYVTPELDVYLLPITGVEKLGKTEHVCITVDADDHLYVSGVYVVTHNTFFAQNFATQCVLFGMPVFFINPKAADALDGLCDYINDSTSASADKISMMKAEEEPGAFDPFRFANDPGYAAEVARIHILDALDLPSEPLGRDRRLALAHGLKRGAELGAQCVWDALDYIVEEEHRTYLKDIIEKQMDGSSLFALGIAKRPRPRLGMTNNHLTLVHFDRELGLPEHTNREQFSIDQRIAIAALKLVTKAALEILIANKGGVMILDEAWTFLSQPEALAALSRISREGRSLNVIPMFLTQKIKDVVTSGLEEFMSRVLVLKLNTRVEAETAFRICGLKPTKQRLEMLRHAGPKPPKDGQPAVWAQGMFRDLQFRHSWVALGPTPQAAMDAWSTNPEDKRRYEEERLRLLAEEQNEAAREAGLSPAELEELIPEELRAVPRAESVSPDVDEPETPVVEEPTPSPFKKPEPAWKKQVDLADEAGTSRPAEGPAHRDEAPAEPAQEPRRTRQPAPSFARPVTNETSQEAPDEGDVDEMPSFAPSPFKKPEPAWKRQVTLGDAAVKGGN